MRKRASKVSKILAENNGFLLDDVLDHNFVVLGNQYKDPSIVHTVFLKRQTLGNLCSIQSKIKLSGYCSYSLVYCDNVGLIGVIFYSFKGKTQITTESLIVSRHVQWEHVEDETFMPLFTLERLDLFLYTSINGSVLVIPTTVRNSPLIVHST